MDARPLIALALALTACSNAEDKRERPQHVLLIVVDTLRADHVGAYGELTGPYAEGPSPTPAIDALARRGALFERAYAQSSWTAPSMVSLMTGRRVAGDRLSVPVAGGPQEDPERLPTIATSFQAAEWATAAFICNDIISEQNGYRGGFDVFEQHTPYVGFEAPIREWFARHAHENSFTYVHLNEPHDPYRPPAGLRYPDAWKKLWQKAPPEISAERRAYFETQRERFGLPAIDADITDIELESARYVDDVHFGDDRVGALLAGLEDAGILDQTLVVLTADHGEGLWTRPAYSSGSRGKIQLEDRKPPKSTNGKHPPIVPPSLLWTLKVTHGNQLYGELTRVPLIMAGPGLPRGLPFDAVVENVDIWPTLLDACGLAATARLDGGSLFELFESSSRWRREKPYALSATRYAATILDHDGWQLITPTVLGKCLEGLGHELYDLRKDPKARKNIASAHPEVVERLQAGAAEMLDVALPQDLGSKEIDANLNALAHLGYVESGLVDNAVEAYRPKESAELIDIIDESGQLDCTQAYYASMALVERKAELTPDELESIKALLGKQQPNAVRDQLKQLFD